MTSPNDNDKNKDAASDAKASGENKADKFASAKETLNKVIYKTGVLAGKAFALVKAVTKDVVQELRNVNSIRKETVATAAEGAKKTELAKTFWTKTTVKQRGIVLGFTALILYTTLSIFSSNDLEKANIEWNNKNYIQAYKLYKKLADTGLARAQYDVGYMHAEGTAVIQSYAEAIRWWQLAAAQGSSEALTSLGYLYMRGIGVEQDITKALQLLRLSAIQPIQTKASAYAQLLLGVASLRIDDSLALMWLNMAITNGGKIGNKIVKNEKIIHSNDGQDDLTRAKELRDKLLSEMTPQQVANAEKKAKECKEKKYTNCGEWY
jgi:hypothetical protein